MLQKIIILLSIIFNTSFVFAKVNPVLLSQEVRKRLLRVSEFDFIVKEANKMGVKVYLFGGTAAAFAHYVRWDLERENGFGEYIAERFNYDFISIYRANQDLDIVIDGSAEQAALLKKILASRYPHFQGEREAWEVRLLRKKMGDKLPLLGNSDFLDQHTDSNSTGLIHLNPSKDDFTFRDLKAWEELVPDFLMDISLGKIRYIYSDKHESTRRFKKKLNPPVLSAIRYLAKLTQYELEGTEEDLRKVTEIIQQTNFSKLSSYAQKKAEEFGLKVLLNSPNLEYASEILDRTGLREKLIKMDKKGKKNQGSLSWWMNKEPLKSYPIEKVSDHRTAADLFSKDNNGDIVVSHETENFEAYESIMKAPSGAANVFVSRRWEKDEAARYGRGFYVQLGNSGFRAEKTGLTIRMKLDPQAVEGRDFVFIKSVDFLVIKNKSVLKVIPDKLDFDIKRLFDLLISGEIGENDKGLLERLRRKYERKGVTEDEMTYINEKLSEVEWTNKNFSAFVFWFTAPFLKKDKSIIEKYANSNRTKEDDLFSHLKHEVTNSSQEFQTIIAEEFAQLDFNKIFIELNESSIFSMHQRINIAYLVALFNTYKSVQDNPKLLKELDMRVMSNMKKIIDFYHVDGGFFQKFKQFDKNEIEKIAKYIVTKVRQTDHFDDDVGLMLISKFLVKSYWKRLKTYYSGIGEEILFDYFKLIAIGFSFLVYYEFLDINFFTSIFFTAIYAAHLWDGKLNFTVKMKKRSYMVKNIKKFFELEKKEKRLNTSNGSCHHYLNLR